ncbi:hypothetical protein X975_15340, partial [Stegodyphus mimosarum]
MIKIIYNSKKIYKGKKDNTYCCVPQCKSKGSTNPELSFHKFPRLTKSNDDVARWRRMKWICALRIGREITKRMCVCSKHFQKTDYVLPYILAERPRLKRTAVPSLFLPSASIDYDEELTSEKEIMEQDKRKLASEEMEKREFCEIKVLKEERNIAAEALLQLSDVNSDGNCA